MHKLTEQQQREKKVQKVAVDIAMGQAPVVVVVVIEAVRAWFSEMMIRRRRDMEPAGADAAAAEVCWRRHCRACGASFSCCTLVARK